MNRLRITAVLVVALAVPPLIATAQSVRTRWEYLRLTLGVPPGPNNQQRVGYQACAASGSEWICREFVDPRDPIVKALSTLGDDGWELVTVIGDATSSQGLTYLFKRGRT